MSEFANYMRWQRRFRFRMKWMHWMNIIQEWLCFNRIHVSASSGSDVIGDGSKSMPFQSIAKGLAALSSYSGRAKFLLKGGDVWHEEMHVNSPCRFLVVREYGGGRPTIECSNGIEIDRQNTVFKNMNVVVNHTPIPAQIHWIGSPWPPETTGEE
jgi:hypothetical protein